MRIAITGIGHETNTFSTLRTTLSDFYVRRGAECTQGEFWDDLRAQGVVLVPILTAGATPHGLVERTAYDALKQEILKGLSEAMPLDGVYLNLHGAMDIEEIGDGETDLVRSVRAIVGPETRLASGLDLHGNLSPEFVGSMDILTALRTAPHRDGIETRARAMAHLLSAIREDRHPKTAMVKLPLILPGENAVTDVEPSKSLYGMIAEIESVPGVWDASLMIGCAWTDSEFTSVSPLVVSEDLELAAAQAECFASAVWDRRAEFGPEVETVSLDDAIQEALQTLSGPVFISDSGDNVTAGGAGDLPVALERLLAFNVRDALVAGITDAAAVQRCWEMGIGAMVDLSIGGKLDPVNSAPLELTARVLSATPSMAVIQVHGVIVVLIDGRRPFHSLAAFEPSGIDPLSKKIVVVKQGYLAPELRERASRSIMALTPGFTDLRLDTLPYRRIRRPTYPLDAGVKWP